MKYRVVRVSMVDIGSSKVGLVCQEENTPGMP